MPLIKALARRKFLENGPAPQVLNMGTNLASMLLCLKHGQTLEAPASDASETLFCVLAGSGFVREGSEEHAVETGDVVHVSAGDTKALIAGEGELSVLGVRYLKGRS
ncbi:MAG TPA: hypothetical protein VF168_10485 [Trueperaceae bacterium]